MAKNICSCGKQKSPLGVEILKRLYIIGKSQNWLAKQVNVTPAHISLIIAGKVTPSQPVLKDIATALGLESSELVKYLF